MKGKRFLILLAVLVLVAIMGGCQQKECCVGVDTQGVSHMSGPLDLTDTATAAAPGLYFAGDSDTGLYSAAANQLGFSTGGTVRMTLSSAGVALTSGLTVGVDGTSYDVIFYSDTEGDYLHWDQDAEQLIITGTNATTVLDIPDGNVVINDDLTVTAGGFDVTAGATTLEALTTGVSGVGADVIFHSDTGGEELTWDASEEQLILDGIDATTVLDVVDGDVVIEDDLTVTSGTFDVTAGATTLEALTVGVSGTGADVIFHSDTEGEEMTWDEGEEQLILDGIDTTTVLDVTDGNVDIADDLNVGGTTNLDLVDIDDLVDITRVTGTTEQPEDIILAEWTNSASHVGYDANGIYMSSNPIYDIRNAYALRGRLDMRGAGDGNAVSVNQLHAIDACVNLNETKIYTVTDNISAVGAAIHGGTSNDIVAEGATGGSLNLYYGMWGTTATRNLSVATNGVWIGSHPETFLDFGLVVANSGTMQAGLVLNNHESNSPASMEYGILMESASGKMGDGLNMEGADFSGADIVMDEGMEISNSTAGVIAISEGDVTLTDEVAGGNLGVKSEFIGLPRIKIVGVGSGTNPASQTISWMDDTPANEYAAVTGQTVLSDDTGVVKYGTNSLKIAWAAGAVATDGFIDAALGGNASFEDMESVGLLVRSTVTWASGDLTLVLKDNGSDRTFNIPALTETDTWVWLEVDITSLDAGSGDTISDISILMSTQGATALGAFDMYVDIMWTWDSDDEEDLGEEIVLDGILGMVDPADGTNMVEFTNYIIHYESGGNTFLVWVSNESTVYPMIMIAYQ